MQPVANRKIPARLQAGVLYRDGIDPRPDRLASPTSKAHDHDHTNWKRTLLMGCGVR